MISPLSESMVRVPPVKTKDETCGRTTRTVPFSPWRHRHFAVGDLHGGSSSGRATKAVPQLVATLQSLCGISSLRSHVKIWEDINLDLDRNIAYIKGQI